MTYGSLFSGCGGADFGFEKAGLDCKWQCEINPDCLDVLNKHWPAVRKFTDVTAFAKLLKHYLRTKNYEAINRLRTDVICGGSPCQDLSVAGKRAGLDGERSGLFRDMVRICLILQPSTIVWENVPGVFSSNDGKDFAAVIGYFTGIVPQVPEEGWGNAGFFKGLPGLWNMAYRVLDSQFFGVPQRRRRVFAVFSFGDGRCCEILFEPESLFGNPPPRREERQEIAGRTSGSLGCHQIAGTIDCKSASANRGHQPNEDSFIVADTIKTTPKAFGGNNQSGPIDIATALNACASASGRLDFESETFLVEEPAPTLDANYGPQVIQKPIAFSCQEDVAPTLRAMGHSKSHANGGGQLAIAIQEGAEKTNLKAGPAGDECQNLVPVGIGGSDIGFTLRATPSHSGDKGDGGINTTLVAEKFSGVRRLTPRECERLQAAPDDFTRYRSDGSEISDSARYRMLGNAWTFSVGEWIAKRINRSSSRKQSTKLKERTE